MQARTALSKGLPKGLALMGSGFGVSSFGALSPRPETETLSPKALNPKLGYEDPNLGHKSLNFSESSKGAPPCIGYDSGHQGP